MTEVAPRVGTAAAPGGAVPLVSVQDLHVGFERNGERISALRGVSLELKPGEILGLVGESGSGKSVLGLALLGLLPTRPNPTLSGSAVVCGTDMVTADAEQGRLVRKQHLGAVFQDPMTSLNPTMRVGRQVVEAAGSVDEAVRLLDAVGVPEPRRRLRAYPHELSGGLRQRVMIAMAIAGNPALVIADEPTTALDVTVQAQILELLATLRRELGTSFILVTHDLGVAAQVSDRIAVLYGGRLAEVGPAADLFEAPLHPYATGLLRSRLLLESDRGRPIVTLKGEPPDPRHHPPGCPFGPRCAHHADACDSALPPLIDVGFDGSRSVACVRLGRFTEAPVTELAAQWEAEPEPGNRRPAVLVHGAHKRFPVGSGLRKQSLHALRGVDLAVDEGEAVALVGESGCGKSTLLRSIAGLQRIDEGSIEFGRGSRPQMVFQDAGASLTPWLTVGEQIGERLADGDLTRAERRSRVDEALGLVGLPVEVARAKPAQLSGGQRQRVALARATVVPPEILLCDEPTSALDVSLAATVLNLIGRLRRELGMAVLFVTHDLAAARMVGDRIAVMYLGRIVEVGRAEQLCADPVHPYTRALLDTVPELGRVHIRLSGEPGSPMDPPSGCEFHPRCPAAEEACASRAVVLEAVDGTPPDPSYTDPEARRAFQAHQAHREHQASCPVFIDRNRRVTLAAAGGDDGGR
ncbi:MAG: dipeptide ABC transporter ATP-binding protein [Acidimicrobiales bacterium]